LVVIYFYIYFYFYFLMKIEMNLIINNLQAFLDWCEARRRRSPHAFSPPRNHGV